MDNTNNNQYIDKTKQQEQNWPCSFCKPEHYTKLNNINWLKDIPSYSGSTDLVEVHFKNTRKEIFHNINQLRLREGDIVAVEASPGHDIGIVSLTGELVLRKLKKLDTSPEETEFKNIYRKAKETDIEKWREAVSLEHKTMIKARKIARDLNLEMKIGDVEYQGDKTKAIFYYIAEERVDFRELIKILAEEFKIRIEMRQIGTRQESGRIGGIGSCGRELCCSSWLTDFVSVTTNSARHQELSLNPQKLAGQCGKLKCCLNYELDCYIDAKKNFPDTEILLETKQGTAYHQKTDIFKKTLWYSFSTDSSESLIPVSVERVKQIISINQGGNKPDALIDTESLMNDSIDFENNVGQESLDRFDKKARNKKKRKSTRKKRKSNGKKKN
ncbi:MAG: regulatory iron-sulfur-containing complex subunit RicT [Bacteroidales bacterium]